MKSISKKEARMPNSPYQDAINLLREVHEYIDDLSRVSLLCPESIHDELRKLREDLKRKINRVDNSSSLPEMRSSNEQKSVNACKDTFE